MLSTVLIYIIQYSLLKPLNKLIIYIIYYLFYYNCNFNKITRININHHLYLYFISFISILKVILAVNITVKM